MEFSSKVQCRQLTSGRVKCFCQSGLGLESIVDKALIDSVDMTLRVWKDLLCSASFPVVGSEAAVVPGGSKEAKLATPRLLKVQSQLQTKVEDEGT